MCNYSSLCVTDFVSSTLQEIVVQLQITICIDYIDYVTGIVHKGILRVPSMLYKMDHHVQCPCPKQFCDMTDP